MNIERTIMPSNPPIPVGYKLMTQIAVTPPMTAWAVEILRDPVSYPMFQTTLRSFGGVTVLARVEWHQPDFNNATVHRGVTLYEPIISALAPDPGADPPLPVPATTLGIDLSGYQPTVNWAEVAASGIAFAFIKATEGTTLIDHTFKSHWSDAKAAGLLRGAYHFFRPQLDAAAQARIFLSQLQDSGELPPVLDVETGSSLPPSQIASGIATWLELVTATTGRPIIYTMPGFWNTLPVIPGIADKADLWVAHWGARVPAAVSGFPDWKFWQYTNKATISGVPGFADMDEDRFNGSLEELRAYSAEFMQRLPPRRASVFDLSTTRGIQGALNVLRLADPSLVEDGVRGPLTATAIEAFQRQQGLTPDGIVGSLTIAALQAALAVAAP